MDAFSTGRWLAIPLLAAGVLGTAVPANPGSRAAISTEAGFLEENRRAMRLMMAGMAVKPCGDVDRDFAAVMIPHHQGAINMAQAELRHGQNEKLRRIAQEIIVEQQQEISAMRLALGQPVPSSAVAPDQPSNLPPSPRRP